MKIRLLGFASLTAINMYVTYSLWDTLLISTLPVCLILLSVFCSGLFLINVKSGLQRVITYFLSIVIAVIGLYFAIYYRRPLGFLAVFSSTTVIVKVIQDTLGHKDISTTLNIYTDVTKELRKSEFEGLDSYFKNEYNKVSV